MSVGTGLRWLLGVIVVTGSIGAVAGCGGGGPEGAASPSATASTATASSGCAPVPGEQLVLLADDRKLQAVNNILPAVHAASATRTLIAVLDRASAALTAERLISLNKATDVDRRQPKEVAEEFARAVRLTDGISRGSGGRIVIGSGNTSESQTLSFIYRIALTAAGFDVRVQPVGDREAYLPTLRSGGIDVVPEYLSTLTEFLNEKINGVGAKARSSSDVSRTVAALKELGARRGLKFGKPAPAAAQNGFAVTKELAEKYGLRTLSDFAGKCSGEATVLAGPANCREFSFCEPGLKEKYGLEAGSFSAVDSGGPLTKEALTSGTATIGLVFTSDAALAE